jgi:hypothetical protein
LRSAVSALGSMMVCALAASVAVAWALPQVETAFENLEVLTGVSAGQMTLIMEAANRSLGVECEYCHVVGQWHLDDRGSKQVAREMMRMLASLSATDFDVLELPSCWTCHRGSTVPDPGPPPGLGPPPDAPGFSGEAVSPIFSTEPGPARQVYENLEQYGDLPADALRGVMESYARSLGVECSHCHVAGDWASDAKVTKLVARRMLEIENRIERDFLGGSEVISCWTCHRGEATPSIALPAE